MSNVGRAFAAQPVVQAGSLTKAWDARLVSCVVDENVGLPDAAVLTYHDDNFDLLADAVITIGTPIRVSVSSVLGNAQELLFAGEVTAVEADADSTGTFTVIRAMNKAHRLFRGRKVMAFRNTTAAQVVRRVAKGAGLTVGRVDVAPVTYAQISQPAISDWEFLQLIAQEHGVVVQVDDQGTLELVKPRPAAGAPPVGTSADVSPLVLHHRDNLRSVRASLSSVDQVSGVEVRGWDVATKKALVAVEPAVVSTTVTPGMSPTVIGKAFRAGARTLVADMPYATQAETAVVARSMAAAASAGFAEIEAVADGEPKLRAGVPVTLSGVGDAFSGRYTATSVRHVLEPSEGYRSIVTVSTSPDRSLAGLTNGGGAPPRTGRMPGLATAIVTDIKEVGGERGWVRLKFPWLDDNYVTDWVRTVQPGGVRGGGVFSPEVNDEVLVGFEQGSLDRPYVLGGLYNGVDQPTPHAVPLVDRKSGRVNRRSLVSRGGNRLDLLDGMTAAGVRLTTGDKRLDITLDEKTGQVDIQVRGPGGGRALGSITLTNRGITVDAMNGDLVLNGRSVSVNGATVSVKGTDVSVKGVKSTTVDGGLRAVLKGAQVHINPPLAP
ncbi:VgrG-related protein [Saccharothrix deserti]|uniref:VgrG-related protein n=1 Tax=Saccharothrix deserti TaxID=2593674 RepID=UPI00131DFFBA|nr:VgrG-related protein [Saccharothrix deserti]